MLPPLPRGLLPFNAIVFSAGVAGLIATRNGEFLFYLIVLLILATIVGVVHRRVSLSPLVLWGLSAWSAAHLAGGLLPVPEGWPINGEVRVLYSLWLVPGWLKYDQIVHAFGFGISTLLCHEGLLATTGTWAGTRTAGMLVLFAALAALGLGATNEVIEFAATLLVPETNVGGYVNTGWDLVANTVGAILASLFLLVRKPDGTRVTAVTE